MLSVSEAAARLAVEPRLVRSWIAAGRLPAERIGDRWAIDEADVEAFARSRVTARGRRFDASTAWGLLALLSGEQAPWLHPSARSRLRSRLGSPRDAIDLLRRSGPRSEVRRWSALESDILRLSSSRRFTVTGLSVPMAIGLHPSRRDFDAYMTAEDVRAVEQELKPRVPRSDHHANLVLRVPSHSWILGHDVAPNAVVAADLLDDPSERVRLAASRTLEGIVRDRDP